jgi:hypothetical protein
VTKKMMYVTTVTATNKKIAHRIRRTRYWNTVVAGVYSGRFFL